MNIAKIKAKTVPTSSSQKSIGVKISIGKFSAFSSVPMGTSTGKYEKIAFPKNGVEAAVGIVNRRIGALLKSMPVNDLYDILKIEKKLAGIDGTANLRRIGGNAILAILLALLRALAKSNKLDVWQLLSRNARHMPMPIGNVIGGGAHSPSFSPDFQEYLIMAQAKTFEDAAKISREIYMNARHILKKKGMPVVVNREGALCSDLSNTEPFELLEKASSSYSNIRFGIDFASSQFYKKGFYTFKKQPKMDKMEYSDFIASLVKDWGLFYIEDPFHEQDFRSFSELRRKFGNRLICADDLIATNPKRLETAIKGKACNAAIVKPNQVCLLSQLFEFVKIAKRNGIKTVFSHRSQETADDILSDLSFGLGADFIKTGIFGKFRENKLKRMVAIERKVLK